MPKKVECGSCGEKAVCQTKTIWGKEVELCDKCIADIEDGDLINDLINGLTNQDSTEE